MSETTTNEKGQIFVDGKPFFPISISVAFWGGPYTEAHINPIFAELKAAGFNTIRDQNSINSNGYMSFTDKIYTCAENNGLKVALLLRNGPNRPEIYKEAIGKYKASPAAFSWEVWDEPTANEIPDVELAYNRIQNVDTAHICYVIFMHASSAYYPNGTETWLDYATTVAFPIRAEYDPDDKYIQTVVTKFSRIFNAWGGKKPTSFIVQGMGAARSAGHVAPTLEQERYMTYATIAKGATGIMWYNYDHAEDEPTLLQDIKQVAGELNYLHDALAQGHPTESVSVAGGEVLTRFHKVGNKGYLIAVNNELYDIGEVTFTSPYYIRTAKTLFEDTSIKDVNGTTFTDTFNRIGVHVYELTLEEQPDASYMSLLLFIAVCIITIVLGLMNEK